jgi:hypothetical protein
MSSRSRGPDARKHGRSQAGDPAELVRRPDVAHRGPPQPRQQVQELLTGHAAPPQPDFRALPPSPAASQPAGLSTARCRPVLPTFCPQKIKARLPWNGNRACDLLLHE